MESSRHNISVAVRVRPLLPKELATEQEAERSEFLPAQKCARKIISVLDERVLIFGKKIIETYTLLMIFS